MIIKGTRFVAISTVHAGISDTFFLLNCSSDEGVGLAAPQVGVNVRMMVFNPSREEDSSEEVVLVNPAIVKWGKKRDFYNEGCLSFRKVDGQRELLLGDVEVCLDGRTVLHRTAKHMFSIIVNSYECYWLRKWLPSIFLF